MPLGPCNKAAPGAHGYKTPPPFFSPRAKYVLGQRQPAQGSEQGQVLRHLVLCLVRQPRGTCRGRVHHQKTRDARRQPCACLWSRSSSIISRNAHALRLRARSYHALHTPVAAPSSRSSASLYPLGRERLARSAASSHASARASLCAARRRLPRRVPERSQGLR